MYQPDRRFASAYNESSIPWLDQYLYIKDPDKEEPEKVRRCALLERRSRLTLHPATSGPAPGRVHSARASLWGGRCSCCSSTAGKRPSPSPWSLARPTSWSVFCMAGASSPAPTPLVCVHVARAHGNGAAAYTPTPVGLS